VGLVADALGHSSIDTAAVHRFLVKHLGVLHRDIGMHNIYIMPKCKRKSGGSIPEGDRPKFIKELLDYTKPVEDRYESFIFVVLPS
jgi:hypothetical protein